MTARQTRRFARHHLEMLVAMFAGMGVLGVPALRGHGHAEVAA